MTEKAFILIDRVLPYIPPFGEFDLLERIKQIHLKHNESASEFFSGTEHLTASQYLVDNGFVLERKGISNPLREGSHLYHFLQLTDKGRKLQDCGNLKEYQATEQTLRDEIKSRNQRDKNTYVIQYAIAIATGVAAIYYLLEIVKTLIKWFSCA